MCHDACKSILFHLHSQLLRIANADVLQCNLFYMRDRGYAPEVRQALQSRIAKMHILTLDTVGFEKHSNIAAIPYATRFHFAPGEVPPTRDGTAQLGSVAGAARRVLVNNDLRWSGLRAANASEVSQTEAVTKLNGDPSTSAPAPALTTELALASAPRSWQPDRLSEHPRPLLFSYLGLNSRGTTFSTRSWRIKRQVS